MVTSVQLKFIMKAKRSSLVYGTTVIGQKGQIVIPVKLRKDLNLKPGDTIFFIGSAYQDAFNVIKAESVLDLQRQINSLLKGDGSSEEKPKDKVD